MSQPIDLDALFRGVRITFSPHCHSGIASYISLDHRCGCRRCRSERGEQWTEETELEAAAHSKLAQAEMRRSIKEQIAGWEGLV